MDCLKAIFVVGGLYSRANGVAWIMRDLAAALGRAGMPIDVYGADCIGRGQVSIGDIFTPPSTWHSAKGLWLGGLSWSPPTKRLIRQAVQKCDVVHNHSLWMLPNAYSSSAARRWKKPMIITAHGALEPWALQHSGWKKQLVGKWFQFRDLHSATCLHVNSHNEMAGLRSLGFTNPIAIIPNGIHHADFANLPDAERFRSQWPVTRGKPIALFMARLHKKKGLEVLIKAWAELRSEFRNWHLIIAGPDDGFRSMAEQLLKEMHLADCITLVGNLQGQEKLSALSAADIFVQPSFSEGFSMSILEAMACGVPALITPGCNFPEAETVGASVCVEPNIESVRTGLASMLRLSKEQRQDMGARGQRLVLDNYTWDKVAAQTAELYHWAARKDHLPSFVYNA